MAGNLMHQDRVVAAKVGTYNRITPAGKPVLAAAKARLREPGDDVPEGDGPMSVPDPPAGHVEGTEES